MTINLLLGGDAMLGRKVNEAIGECGPDYPLRDHADFLGECVGHLVVLVRR
ncbi:MAG: hypothetical protein U5L04_00920 [Trueperaceae bacterium]|nr:hypothetical protein [Trueperaceae bacterium]